MINVLEIIPYRVLPAKTGGQRFITMFDQYISGKINLFTACPRSTDITQATGYTIYNIFSDSAFRYANIFYFFSLRRIIRKQQITHVMANHPYLGWLVVMLKMFCGVKMIVRSHNIEATRWQTLGKSWWKILWYYEKWVHRQADMSFFIQETDRQYAIKQFGLQSTKTTVITFGIEQDKPTTAAEKQAARQYLQQEHGIPAHHHILLFNGAFNYLPNLNGLKYIMNDIAPLLKKQADFPYTILVCGKDIPETISHNAPANFVFAGFVKDINTYFAGADVFMNAVIEGGGIKTKLVEALGLNLNAVSTMNGAIGVDPAICNGKLVITANQDWEAFAAAVIRSTLHKADTPQSYYQQFNYGYITTKATRALEDLA